MVVTISNEYGAGAIAIARRAAAALGYEFVDRQLPVVVAKRLSVAPDVVDETEDAERSLGERFLQSLELATPEMAQSVPAENFDETMLRAVRDAVREYAAHGNAVIVGRGAGFILGASPGVLRVFLYAPREWRVARVAQATGVAEQVARDEVDRIDRARRTYLKQWYNAEFGNPASYDLCIDTARLSEEAAASVIVAAARAGTV